MAESHSTPKFCECGCGQATKMITPRESSPGHGYIAGQYRRFVHGHNANVPNPVRSQKEYAAWSRMKHRCYNPNNPNFHNYGGRGISVCHQWMDSFDIFKRDMGDRPSDSHSLDRINSNGNYEPSNCRWATSLEQVRGRRVTLYIYFEGELMLLTEAAKSTGINYTAFHGRQSRRGTLIRLSELLEA